METKVRFSISRKMGRTVRLNLITGISLILPLLLVGSMISVVFAALGDETTAGTLTLTPTYECIGVYADFSGDNNEDNSALLYYRVSGSPNWIQGMDMTPDRRDTVQGQPNPYENQWRASILGLQPNTEYEVRVTFSDPDNASDITVTETVTTRNDDFDSLSYSGTAYYVATNDPNASDNESTNDGSEALPFKTIQKAVDMVSPGDTVYVKAGTYVEGEEIKVETDGTPDNYITIRNYGDDVVTVNATDNPPGCGTGNYSAGFHIMGSYVRIKGFEVIGAGVAGGRAAIMVCPLDESREIHDVIIEDCVLRDNKTLSSTPADYNGILMGGQSTGWWTLVENITVQRNDIYVVSPGGPPSSGPGIMMQNANGGHVIRNNNIVFTGTLEVHGSDGINSKPNSSITYTIRDTDIHGNYIQGATDDAISLDGNSANVRVWGNVITRANMGISVAPIMIGPAYIFRNVWYDPEKHWSGTGWTKGGENSRGHVYFYHNTVVYDNVAVGTTFPDGSGKDATSNFGFTHFGSETDSHNQFSLNNIIETDGPIVSTNYLYPEMDYDLLYNHFAQALVDYWAQWRDGNCGSRDQTNAENFAAFQARTTAVGETQEVHGVPGQATFVDRANGDFSLANGSLGINQGVVIRGFNDASSPWPYSGSAPDIGAYEYDSGPTSPEPPVLDPIGDKSVKEGHLLQFTVSATDPNNDLLTYSANLTSLPPEASFDPATRTFSWTPTSGQAGTYSNVQFQVSDPVPLTDSENITITVTTNTPPVLDTIGDKSVNEGQLLQFSVSANDTDGDPLTCSASNLPTGATFTDNGDSTGSFSWTPAYDQAGSHNVQFQVSDGGLTDSENITITVNNVNGPPVLDPIGDKSVIGGQLLEFTISATDPDGDPLTCSANNTPPGASFTDNGDGTGSFSWPSTSGQAGSYPNVQFQVSAGTGTDSESITIIVGVPPSLPLRVNCAGSAYTDSSGYLWQADQAYASGIWGFYGNNNTVDRGTGHAIAGTDDDRIYQTERWGSDGYRFDLGNGTYKVTLHFAETFSGVTGPDQRIFDVSIEGQLVLDDLDIYSEAGHSTALTKAFSNIAVQDGQLDIAFASLEGYNPEINGIEIVAAGSNIPPAAQNDAYSVDEDDVLTVAAPGVLSNDSDANSDPLTATLVSDVSNGTLSLNTNGSFTYTPDAGYSGSDSFTYRANDGQIDSNTATVTITVTVNTTSPTGGGSGGGGGGGGLLPIKYRNSQGILVDGTINFAGEVRGTIKVYSTDGKVMATIPVGTYAKDEKGRPLSELMMIVDESPLPAQEGTTVIGTAYNFQPDGATFEPAITVVWSYEPGTIPDDVSEGELFAAYWDGNKWVALESTVNIEDNTVSAAVAHFTPFAIFGTLPPAPAEFTASGLSVSSGEVLIGESVTISVLVTNTGELSGTHDVSLKVDDVVKETKELTLAGGGSQEVTFIVSADATGTYAIDIDGLSGTFEVIKRTATFVYSDLSISPAEVYIGEEAAISMLVTNSGDVSGTHEVMLKIDNAMVATKELTLDGGASQKVTFATSSDTAGVFTVGINGTTGSLQVKEAISDFNVTPIYDGSTGFPFGADPSVRGDKLVLARIDYRVNQLHKLIPEAKLILKVLLDGVPLEEISLLSSSQLQPDGNSVSLDYIPSQGWMIGTYTFEAELRNGGIVQRTKPEQLQVMPESVAVVSWETLSIIIGATLIVIVAMVVVVLYRRRDMLRGHID